MTVITSAHIVNWNEPYVVRHVRPRRQDVGCRVIGASYFILVADLSPQHSFDNDRLGNGFYSL